MYQSGEPETQAAQGVRQAIPFLLPFLFGAGAYFAFASPYLFEPKWAIVAVISTFFVLVGASIWLSAVADHAGETPLERLVSRSTPTSLVAGAYLFLLFVDYAPVRGAVVMGTMLLLIAFFAKVNVIGDHGFRNLARALRMLALFFILVFVFGIERFVNMPISLLLLAVGGIVWLGTSEEYRAHANPALRRRASTVVAILAMQVSLALHFLPTPYLTNAAVVLISTAMLVSIFRPIANHIMPSTGHRKQLIVSTILGVMVLVSSPWF